MKSNTQNAKIEAITEKTLILGIDVGNETHYARAFDYRGIEYSRKPFKFSNTEAGFVTFKEWILDLKERHGALHRQNAGHAVLRGCRACGDVGRLFL